MFSSFLVLASKTLTLSTNKLDKDIILLHKYFWRKSSLAHAAPTPKEHWDTLQCNAIFVLEKTVGRYAFRYILIPYRVVM